MNIYKSMKLPSVILSLVSNQRVSPIGCIPVPQMLSLLQEPLECQTFTSHGQDHAKVGILQLLSSGECCAVTQVSSALLTVMWLHCKGREIAGNGIETGTLKCPSSSHCMRPGHLQRMTTSLWWLLLQHSTEMEFQHKCTETYHL